MVDVSNGLSQYFMVDRIIGNIRVSMNKKGHLTIKNEKHHSVTPELLTRKWGIGLEKSKETLKATTQDSIFSSPISLTRRYSTHLIPQLLRRL